jgi:hypothetical protein
VTFPTTPTTGANTLLASVQGTATTTHTFGSLTTLDNASGDLLIAVIVLYQASGTANAFSSWGGGFTEFGDSASATNPSMAMGCAYKISDGTETGTFTVTSSISGRSAMFLMSVKNWHGTTVPEVAFSAATTTTAQDPPSLNPAGWDTEDTLWIAVAAGGQTSLTGSWGGITSAPTNYTNYAESSIAGGDAVGACQIAVAFRGNAVSAENPGSFTTDTSPEIERAATIAIRPAPPWGGPVHESHGSLEPASGRTTVQIPVPSGVAADDVIVVQVYKENTAAITPPSGFSEKSQVDNANPVEHTIFWKRATAGDTGTYDFSWTGAVWAGGSSHRISGAVTSGDPFDVIDHEPGGAASTNAPAVQATTTVADTLLFWGATGFNGSTAWTQPSGFTGPLLAVLNLEAAWKAQAAAGDTGALTGSSDASDVKTAFLGALKPPGGDATATPAVIAAIATVPSSNRNIAAGPAVTAGTAALPNANRNVVAGPAVIARPAALAQPNVNVTAGPAVLPATATLGQAVAGQHETVTPAAVTAATAVDRPAVNVQAGPAVAVATATLPPSALNVTAGPALLAAVAALGQATPVTAGNATATPAVLAALAALAQPNVHVAAGPAVLAALVGGDTYTDLYLDTYGAAGIPRPAVHVAAGPAALTAVAALGQATPQVGGNATATPAVLAAVAALPQATALFDFTVTPAVVAALAAVGAAHPNIAAGPAGVAATTAVAVTAVHVAAAPATLPAVVAVPLPAVGVITSVTPASIATVAAVAQAALHVRAGPATVAAAAAFGLAQPGQWVVATPATLDAVASVPAAGAGVGAGVATVVLVVTLPLIASVGGAAVPGYGRILVGAPVGGLVIAASAGHLRIDQPEGTVSVG